MTSTCTFIVPINTTDGEAIVASLQILLKCRVQHLSIKIINIIFHYPSEYCHSTICYIAVRCLTELLPQSTYSNFTDLILHFFFSLQLRWDAEITGHAIRLYIKTVCVIIEVVMVCLYTLSWPFIVCGVCVAKHDCCECTYLCCINALVVYACCACCSHCCLLCMNVCCV